MALIEVRDLDYFYPRHQALKAVSFDIQEHTITALVGPNGAGKSTLIRCLVGLDSPFTGSITLNGIDVLEQPRESHKMIGFLPDFFGVYEELTVTQCLTYMADVYDIPLREQKSRISQTIERLELEKHATVLAGHLSRGLKQRLAIAQAILHAPKMLVLDEPAAGLDPEARQSLARLFVRLKDEGMTLLVSSHILSELEEYSSHLMIMRDGRLISNEPLGSGALKVGGKRLRLSLVKMQPTLIEKLSIHVGVSDVVIENETTLSLVFQGSDEARSVLLRKVIQEGFAVTAFHDEVVSLQDAYLKHVEKLQGRS